MLLTCAPAHGILINPLYCYTTLDDRYTVTDTHVPSHGITINPLCPYAALGNRYTVMPTGWLRVYFG